MGTTGHGRPNEYRYYVHRPIPGEKVTCKVKTVRADKLEEAILNQLDHVLFREGYLDGIERRIDEIIKPQLQNKFAELDRRKSQLAQIQKQIQAAFRLHADMGGDVVDDLFRDELLRLKTEKASVEGAVRELEATMDDELPTGDAGRKNIEVNLAEYRKAKSGANQLLLKRLMRKVVESIVLEPGRIALRYWTSNELRDESQTQKTKRSSDSPSGASILSLKSCESSSLTPSSDGSRDKEVFGLQFIGIGCGGRI